MTEPPKNNKWIVYTFVHVTIAKETHFSAQNDISQEEVFNVWSARFHVLRNGFRWKLWSIFFIRPESKMNACDFFVIFSVAFSVDYDS